MEKKYISPKTTFITLDTTCILAGSGNELPQTEALGNNAQFAKRNFVIEDPTDNEEQNVPSFKTVWDD
ncbi:MAG: hypothetical protein WCS17_00340 [Prevotella sp.]|jgi:hypothetical protein